MIPTHLVISIAPFFLWLLKHLCQRAELVFQADVFTQVVAWDEGEDDRVAKIIWRRKKGGGEFRILG